MSVIMHLKCHKLVDTCMLIQSHIKYFRSFSEDYNYSFELGHKMWDALLQSHIKCLRSLHAD